MFDTFLNAPLKYVGIFNLYPRSQFVCGRLLTMLNILRYCTLRGDYFEKKFYAFGQFNIIDKNFSFS